MTTITIPCPRTMRADDAAYAMNRAMLADDDLFEGIIDALLEWDSPESDRRADPAIHDLLHTLSHDANLYNQFLLDCDICPMHSCDIEICIDDNDESCAHLRNS